MNKYKELSFLQELPGVGPAKINKFYVPLLKSGTGLDALIKIVKTKESKADDKSIEKALKTSDELFSRNASRNDIRIITILDEDYPSGLEAMGNNAPIVLYAKGDISLLVQKSLAVIGTREPGDWSMKVGQQLVGKVIEFSNRVIVSGLAIGCDTVAHKACLENGGKTIAVLPCGFDHISPSQNTELSEEIVKTGGLLITEYPPETEANNYMFTKRDTLTAALSDAIFVLECGVGSGTMYTVDAGIGFNKRVAVFDTPYKDRGNYEGNDLIVKEKSGIAIMDSDGLKKFLDSIGNEAVEKQPEQMTLFDFMED